MSKFNAIFKKFKKILAKRRKRERPANLEPPNLFPEGIHIQPKELPEQSTAEGVFKKRSKYAPCIPRYEEVLFYTNRYIRLDVSQDVEINFEMGENSRSHRTNRFASALTNLIVRRGQMFIITLGFNRRLTRDESLHLEFHMIGFKPALEYGTLVYVKVEDSPRHAHANEVFSARILSNRPPYMTIEIVTPFDCRIGPWNFAAFIVKNSRVTFWKSSPNPVYILFNPWCEDDDVHMNGEECKEYVLGDLAYIYRGSIDENYTKVWAVEQYQPNVLECAFYLLSTVYKLPAEHYSSSIHVARAIASAVNANDNGGILLGNWDSPEVHKFNGSGYLIRKYYRTKRSVGPAQCWVFAGVYLTIARALGIPCRLITGYQICISGNYKRLLASKYWFSDGTHSDNYSLWNFHAWCETWMARQDLHDGGRYDGWQICDGTPQVSIDGLCRIGPLSRKAIKFGHITKPFNTIFSYAQTNSDIIEWYIDTRTNEWTLLKADATTIGAKLVTNLFNTDTQKDITLEYKFPEGSKRERSIMEKALKLCGEAESLFYVNNFFEKILYTLSPKPRPAVYGQDIAIELSVSNKSNVEPFSISGTLLIDIASYNGSNNRTFKSMDFSLDVPPLTTKMYKVPITFEQYRKNYQLYESFTFRCLGYVKEKGHYFTSTQFLTLNAPKLEVFLKTPSEGGPEMQLMFQNPLPRALHKCRLHVTDSITKEEKKIKSANIRPGSEAAFPYEIGEPIDLDKLVIWTYFSSKELKFSTNHLMVGGKFR